jgi:hypothetical protein
MIIPVVTKATRIVRKGSNKNLEAIPGQKIQQIHYKRQLYLEHHI